MGLGAYTPNNQWWDVAITGQLELPQGANDIWTWDNLIVSTVGTNPSGYTQNGAIAKILDNLAFLKRAQYGTTIPVAPSLTREQELRVVNVKTPGTELVSGGGTRSAYLGQQEGAAQNGTIPTAKSKASGAAGEFFWLALDLPPGGTLAFVSISTIGNLLASPPAHMPTYQVIKYKTNTAEASVSGAATADAHTGVNWLTTVVQTSITVGAVIDPAYKYAVLVTSPWDAGFTTMLEVRGLNLTLT